MSIGQLIQRRRNGYALSCDLNSRLFPIASCKPLDRESRTHSPGLVDLPESTLRALRLALKRITDAAVWDGAALKLECADILELDAGIDLQETGFEMGEIDSFLDDFGLGQEDELPESTVNGPQVT